MSFTNSQENTIYRSLASQIQMGFFDDGERFPSAKEIAQIYQVSYCPAERALKALKRDGLVQLCRGKETVVLKKPYMDYLNSEVFLNRAGALLDLSKTLKLLSPEICFQGICRYVADGETERLVSGGDIHQGKYLYRQFGKALHSLGSQTMISLYNDISFFACSAYLDIVQITCKGGARELLRLQAKYMEQCRQDILRGDFAMGRKRMEDAADKMLGTIVQYLTDIAGTSQPSAAESFLWQPRKGRIQYCDFIAIDMICSIYQGIYPEDTLLPACSVLAEVYHVSTITIRRAIRLLNSLGVVKTINGVGARVLAGDASTILHRLKELNLDKELKTFLEAFQLLAITCVPVFVESFPHFSGEAVQAITAAAARKDPDATISACMHAVIRCCPLASVREIYEKLRLLLLNGSVLRLDESIAQALSGWDSLFQEILESLNAGDAVRFSRLNRQLVDSVFIQTKRSLMRVGVNGADQVADPVEIALE